MRKRSFLRTLTAVALVAGGLITAMAPAATAALTGTVEVWEHVGFTGKRYTITEHNIKLGGIRKLSDIGFENNISSLHIVSGEWCFYDIFNFDHVNGRVWQFKVGEYVGRLDDPKYDKWFNGRRINPNDLFSSIELRFCPRR